MTSPANQEDVERKFSQTQPSFCPWSISMELALRFHLRMSIWSPDHRQWTPRKPKAHGGSPHTRLPSSLGSHGILGTPLFSKGPTNTGHPVPLIQELLGEGHYVLFNCNSPVPNKMLALSGKFGILKRTSFDIILDLKLAIHMIRGKPSSLCGPSFLICTIVKIVHLHSEQTR